MSDRNNRRFAIGVSVVASSAFLLVLIWWLDTQLPSDGDPRGGFVFQYQALIAGLLALVGAFLTVRYLQRQITTAEETSERGRRATLAGINQPAIERLSKLIREDCEHAMEYARGLTTERIDADGNLQKAPHGRPDIGSRVGAALTNILALDVAIMRANVQAKQAALLALRWREEPTEEAERVRNTVATELSQAASDVAAISYGLIRLLGVGWSIEELASLPPKAIIGNLGESDPLPFPDPMVRRPAGLKTN